MMGEVHEASSLKKKRSIRWLQQMDSDLECEVSASSKAPQPQVHNLLFKFPVLTNRHEKRVCDPV
jgi:hypothetical protein